MKRSDFLKRLGMGIIAGAVAPIAVADALSKTNGYNTPFLSSLDTAPPYYYRNLTSLHDQIQMAWFRYQNELTKIGMKTKLQLPLNP